MFIKLTNICIYANIAFALQYASKHPPIEYSFTYTDVKYTRLPRTLDVTAKFKFGRIQYRKILITITWMTIYSQRGAPTTSPR